MKGFEKWWFVNSPTSPRVEMTEFRAGFGAGKNGAGIMRLCKQALKFFAPQAVPAKRKKKRGRDPAPLL